MNRLTLIFAIILMVSCHKENQSDQTINSSHIKYFGFTLIDTYWDDPTDNQTKINYIDEVFGFSNIADILVVNPSDNIVARMTEMNDFQVKSILHLSEIFFEIVGTSSPSGVEYDLRTDFRSRWDEFINTNNLQVNQNLIQSFYIGEEPTWNGISYSELKAATDYVKSTMPTIPIMIIEAYPIIDQLQVPNSVDWIGFDHYLIKDPISNVNYLSELNNLKSKFTNDEQKLVIIMDTHYISSLHGDFGGISLNEMDGVANSYFELAKSEPKTIAILGYFWPSGFDSPESIGARNMPEIIKENYIRIGKDITNKN
jgi:predicted acetyltransferase